MMGASRSRPLFPGLFFSLLIFSSCAFLRPDKGELSLAIKKNDIGTIQKYFSRGGRPDLRLDYERNLLHVASEWGRLDAVKLLIQNGVDVNAVDKAGYTPLMLASQQGKTEVAEALLGAGARIDLQDEAGFTALMAASLNGKEKVVELLLAKGADHGLKNKHGKNALDLARPWGHLTIVRMLENAGR